MASDATLDPADCPIVDAHMDVAWNALYNGRDLTKTVAEIRAQESRTWGTAMTSLPTMGTAGVAVVFATLFAEPAVAWSGVMDEYPTSRPVSRYSTPEQAEAQALEMLDLYQRWADIGAIRILETRDQLAAHLNSFAHDRVPGFVITMEGADPILTPDHLEGWSRRGLRMIGLAWGSTRYAGGSGSSQGLSKLGHELLIAMAELGITHDASHLSEEAFWEAVGLPHHALCVSHGNARALMLPPPGMLASVALNRHLSDEQIRFVGRSHGAASSGMIGLAFLNEFLDPSWRFDNREVDVRIAVQGAAHLHYLARLAGWGCVGIGSDVDSGFGTEETPAELDTIADWAILGDVVPAPERSGVLGGNWLRFLAETLP